MLKEDVIEPTFSERVSPVLCPPKHDGKPRSCAEYRKPSALKVRITYRLQGMN